MSQYVYSQQNLVLYLQSSTNRMEQLAIYKYQPVHVDKDVFLKYLDNLPSFGIDKDNYLITGIPTNKKITNHSADVKFQLSIHQRLTKTILPFNTYLVLSYAQKSFWNVYDESSPFWDNNYNPAMGIRKPIFNKHCFIGVVSLMMEHESNGKDFVSSRSWNFPSLSGIFLYNRNISYQVKVWYPIIGKDNTDLVKYKGYGLLVLNYTSNNKQLKLSAIFNPTDNFSQLNTTLELNYKLSKNANQFLFLQFYSGYAEGLLNYKEYTSMIRIGICIKQDILSFY